MADNAGCLSQTCMKTTLNIKLLEAAPISGNHAVLVLGGGKRNKAFLSYAQIVLLIMSL